MLSYDNDMTASVFVVVNPAAGSGRGRALWPRVANRLHALGIEYEFEGTQGTLTAESFTRQALRRGVETIIAVGGDGTFNETVNGFFSDGEATRPGASLLMVPAGSSSDIARGLGLPMGTAALDLLGHGQTKEIDLGRADFLFHGLPMQRYFLNQADVGIGAQIAKRASRLKLLGGTAAFFLATVPTLIDPRAWSGQVQCDEGPAEPVRALSAVVALGPFTGGGMKTAPGARWDDGQFEVVAIGEMTSAELLMQFPRVYLGTHLTHPKVQHWQAREVEIETQDLPGFE